MPGVLILEAMAQMGGILIVETDPEGARGKGMYLVSLDNVRFRKPVLTAKEVSVIVGELSWEEHEERCGKHRQRKQPQRA
jgi:3-hydroxymyristoyl/3-hydroxydecanoyl-(acyl carrier protein) dehydratase